MLLTADTVDAVDTVYTVDTVNMVNTVDMAYTVCRMLVSRSIFKLTVDYVGYVTMWAM